jgi:hypothetical protein
LADARRREHETATRHPLGKLLPTVTIVKEMSMCCAKYVLTIQLLAMKSSRDDGVESAPRIGDLLSPYFRAGPGHCTDRGWSWVGTTKSRNLLASLRANSRD